MILLQFLMKKMCIRDRANLVRVNDILSELEKQVGPLQVQSEKAKEYLDYKADLKKYDVNAFLLESDRISKDLEELTGKIGIADNDLANSRAEYESTKAEYEEAEEQLSKVNSDIENVNSLLSNTCLLYTSCPVCNGLYSATIPHAFM